MKKVVKKNENGFLSVLLWLLFPPPPPPEKKHFNIAKGGEGMEGGCKREMNRN